MKIIILGKSNQMGATPNIRVKGMSQVRYNFVWDSKIRHFAYEPENQKQVDDIFRTQGKIYRTMYFSVYLDEPKVEKTTTQSAGAKDRPTRKKAKVEEKQAVEELLIAE